MTERVAIVTGAGRGLGRVMALALLKAGHRVFLTSTDSESLDETRRASGAGARAAMGTADLGNRAELRAIVDAALGAFGRVDILVNNAAILNPPSARPLARIQGVPGSWIRSSASVSPQTNVRPASESHAARAATGTETASAAASRMGGLAKPMTMPSLS
jgi:NAD(P)-dependent dehydrogenase (short-subunit alcohol dehydrogenase family)